jgi:hypothetical protein
VFFATKGLLLRTKETVDWLTPAFSATLIDVVAIPTAPVRSLTHPMALLLPFIPIKTHQQPSGQVPFFSFLGRSFRMANPGLFCTTQAHVGPFGLTLEN